MTRRRLLSRVTMLAALATAVALLVVPASVDRASAADLSIFSPGLIVSDGVFYDSSVMSVDAVQAFLSTKGAACTPASDGTPCLKDYRQTTWTRVADSRCSGTYEGAADESAAVIVWKVAQACRINPRVLVVTLQKEQSLVTRKQAGTAAIYQKAMGYGCPDTAACDSKYYGFFNQVYSAASQFRNYANNPKSYTYRAGATSSIQFMPGGVCGSTPVFIQNQATASLYNYTPYQPNAAALAAGYGTGDACSSYGNRNFYAYFTDWFGSTLTSAPRGFLDSVVNTSDSVTVSGWALDFDATGPLQVHVYVDAVPTAMYTDGSRPDIAAAFPGWGDKHGFSGRIVTTEGRHQVCAYAINVPAGDNPSLGCRTVDVVNHAALGFIDGVTAMPATPGTLPGWAIVVQGWALDPDTSGSVGVHVYVDGAPSKVVADGDRPDVGAAFPGFGSAHGFTASVSVGEGRHLVCSYAINVPVSTNTALGCTTVTIVNHAAQGYLDAATGVPGAVSVQGWAFDQDVTHPIGVHVYIDGAFAGALTAGGARPDVAAVFGRPATGFAGTLPVPAGRHQVCAYAINEPMSTNLALGCRTVDTTA